MAALWLGRLLRLDFTAFEEIRADPNSTPSAVIVVLLAGLFAGAGSWLWAVQSRDLVGLNRTDVFVRSLLVGSVMQTIIWFAWVYITYQVLLRGYGARTDFLGLLRTMGFAFVPVALSIFVVFAGLAVPIGMLAFGMALLLTNAAIQAGSDAEFKEAAVANIAGFGVFLLGMGICSNILEVGTFGGIAPGILFFSLDL